MGWLIKTTKTKWNIYSTVSDSIIASFKTQKECAKFIAQEKIYEGKKQAIEMLMTFPHNWNVNDSRCFTEEGKEKMKKHFEWLQTTFDAKTYEEHYKMIDDKLEELLSQ